MNKIGRILNKLTDEQKKFEFLAHTSNFDKTDAQYDLWKKLLLKIKNKKPLPEDRYSKDRALHNKFVDA